MYDCSKEAIKYVNDGIESTFQKVARTLEKYIKTRETWEKESLRETISFTLKELKEMIFDQLWIYKKMIKEEEKLIERQKIDLQKLTVIAKKFMSWMKEERGLDQDCLDVEKIKKRLSLN